MAINQEITARELRLISGTGEQFGIISIQEALEHAEKSGLDLVEISPNATPPVCKLLDYGKYKYQQHKREKENKKKQHVIQLKEIRFRPGTETHDLETKAKKIRSFLAAGNKVKVTVMYRGREMAHKEFGQKTLQQILTNLDDVAKTETQPKMEGRFLSVILVAK